jgi:hypothetical protein
MKTRDRTRKRRRVKNSAGTDAWNREIEPYCEHGKLNRGYQTRVARTMTRDYGVKVLAPQVQQWLAPNSSKRVEPKVGISAILLAACRIEMGQINQLDAE